MLLMASCSGCSRTESDAPAYKAGEASSTDSSSGVSSADSGDDGSAADRAKDSAASRTGDEGASDLSVAFVTNQIADFWRIAEAGCRDASKDLGIEVNVRMPPRATADEQKRIVEDLITAGIDGLAITVLDADNQTEWLNSVAERIPLVIHDADAPNANRLMYIGMNNYKAGRACGQLVKQALPSGGNVALFIGRMEQDNSRYRRQGVIDELLHRDRDASYYQSQAKSWDDTEGVIEGNGFNILATIVAGNFEESQAKAEDAINTYPDMNMMVGLFEYNPPACLQAIKKAGKQGVIQVVGFDENAVTLQAIKDGECVGTVVQNPYQYGYESVRVLTQILRGDKSVIPESHELDIPARAITQENVDEYWADLRAKVGG